MSMQPPPIPPQGGGLTRDEISQIVRDAMSGSTGDQSQRIQTLLTDNFALREAKRQLIAENDALKARVPADGSITLSGDEKATYEALVALKLKPADIATIVAEHATLKASVAQHAQEKGMTEAAAAEGYDATVLGTLVSGQDLVVKPVKEVVDGEEKQVPRAFIQTKGADNVVTEQRLSEYITAKHPKFLPSLMAETDSDNGANSGAAGNGGTKFVKQRASTGTKGTQADPSKAYISKKYRTEAEQGKATT